MPGSRPLVWLRGEIKTPPFSQEARIEAGMLRRRLQQGELLFMPQSRPLPDIGHRCHELRIRDAGHQWRIIYRNDSDAILILEVFDKRRGIPHMPSSMLASVAFGSMTNCRRRSARDEESEESTLAGRRVGSWLSG